MNKKNTTIYIISGILTTILLAYLLLNLDWEILQTAFRNFHGGWFGLALLTYFISIILRAHRFTNLIYSRQVHWLRFMPISALHNILLYLMPAQTGDVTYIFIAKNRLNVSLTEGTATLFAARFYDIAVVTSILAMLLPFSKNDMPDWVYYSAIAFCLVTLLAFITIFIILRISKSNFILDTANTSDQKSTLIRVAVLWKKFIAGLQEIQMNKGHTKTLLMTTGIWMCLYMNHYFATQSMNLPISFYHIALISIVMIPLTLFPVQGFANIGTHEIGWATVLTAFNYPYETALTIAVGSHFMLLISVLLSNGIAFVGSQFIINRLDKKK